MACVPYDAKFDRSIDLNVYVRNIPFVYFCGSYYGCCLLMHISFSLCCAYCVLSDPWRWEDMSSCLLDKIFSIVYGFSRPSNRLYELELNILLACLSSVCWAKTEHN